MAATSADDLRKQMKQADDHKRHAQQLLNQQKTLLQKQVADLDRQISDLQTQRSKAAADLSRA